MSMSLVKWRVHQLGLQNSCNQQRDVVPVSMRRRFPKVGLAGASHPFASCGNGRGTTGRLECRRFRGKEMARCGYVAASSKEFDVVIVGAGIIGLAIANSILTETCLSVATLDAARPCAGATGAGQGYIWLGHRQPGTAGWALASRSKQLWEQLVCDLRSSGLDALDALGWRNTGSLLVASTHGESEALTKWVAALSASGVAAEYLTAPEACKREPALSIRDGGGAALVLGDSQIDADLAVQLLLQRNRAFSSTGRYQELFNESVDGLICCSQDNRIQGVRTANRTLNVKENVVIATGAWSSVLMSKVAAMLNLPVVPPVKPRKGHLLVVEGFPHLQLNHALMEFEYSSNYSVPAASEHNPSYPSVSVAADAIEVAMTLTSSASGHLLLGSSREFKGFDEKLESSVVERMFNRAAIFFPVLADLSFAQTLEMGKVRIGLRPYCSDGRPVIGPVAGVPGLLMATGHEGSGLCMALGTAELVLGMIRRSKSFLDPWPYTPDGRLSQGPDSLMDTDKLTVSYICNISTSDELIISHVHLLSLKCDGTPKEVWMMLAWVHLSGVACSQWLQLPPLVT